ncbi:Lactase-like protein [Orchesella cincta]|uniref:Lactase-like protein n=1 Tax=Orchesella cincta TaxID=48709 RepID=A0A1D2NHR6_ORCCI|nr:Lactase-like protein [Orchesella cincta]
MMIVALFNYLLSFLIAHWNTESFAKDDFIYGQFPSYFRWGIGTSSYQIEGAWNLDGKGENVWDNFTHTSPSPIKDSSTGDIACDSYHKYEEDAKLVKSIGVDFYRFSISWSRILPLGTKEKVNQAGIDYYNNLINSLLHHEVSPVISIHHWDLPQPLQDIGGWVNEDLIEHFGDFARILYQNFGDRVKQWFTFNEAWVICVMGYGDGIFAPGIKEISETPYKCIHTILKAHARAYRIYDEEFKSQQKGQVGITIDSGWLEPSDPNNPEDIEASERALQFKFGMFASPIVFGKYPDIVRKRVDERSKQEGRSTSRLPSFDKYWTDYIKGSYDIIGLNHYSSYLVTPASSDPGPGWYGDQDTATSQDPSWPETGSTWLRPVPWGFRKVLNWIKNTYNNPPLIVTENGYSDLPNVVLNDYGRIEYYKGYINNLLKAVIVDGCNVRGYSAWSLMDNFEWASGYTERFGLHNRERIPKESVKFLKNVFRSNGFRRPNLPWDRQSKEQCDIAA